MDKVKPYRAAGLPAHIPRQVTAIGEPRVQSHVMVNGAEKMGLGMGLASVASVFFANPEAVYGIALIGIISVLVYLVGGALWRQTVAEQFEIDKAPSSKCLMPFRPHLRLGSAFKALNPKTSIFIGESVREDSTSVQHSQVHLSGNRLVITRQDYGNEYMTWRSTFQKALDL